MDGLEVSGGRMGFMGRGGTAAARAKLTIEKGFQKEKN